MDSNLAFPHVKHPARLACALHGSPGVKRVRNRVKFGESQVADKSKLSRDPEPSQR